jgi:two-component system sensor histidine kinase KdpD
MEKIKQCGISTGSIVLIALVCFSFRPHVDYRIVALILLLAVSVLGVILDILPVLLAAILSSVILNLFFLEPVGHYKINNSENALLFFIYLLVALVSAVLTHRLRRQEAKVRDKEEKEKTLNLYNTLLSSLSHELKTPISTILGGIDLLKTGDLKPELNAELVQEIDLAAARLNTQVENLLNMSRLETGTLKLKRDWCDVNELVFHSIGLLGGREIRFTAKEEIPLVKVDLGLMETLLYGLLNNARLYAGPDSPVGVEVNVYEEVLEIRVWDQGPGIPEEERDRVYEKFYRLPHSGTGGTGLGLSIAKGICQAHDGTIHVEENQGGGAVFVVRIPAEMSYLKSLKND